MMKSFLLLLLVCVCMMEAYHPTWMHALARRTRHSAVRQTPQSDDIFDVGAFSSRNNEAKRQYLQEDWQFTAPESAVLKPFREKMNALHQDEDLQDAEVIDQIEDENEEVPHAPMFAVIYKFKPEYLDSDMDESIKAHQEYSQLFPYIISDEVLRVSGHRGAVSIWIGNQDEDESIIKQEIDKYIAADPFIKEEKVEEWDVLDISTSTKEELSPEEQKQYDELLAERRQELMKLLQDNEVTL